ncbi:hypothetical protein STVA_31490 [Allostella vacuolata]|nr:hypothetical protein STVA_31490 [Stella vacuolata]
MHRIRRFLSGLALAILAAIGPVSAIACDPETMNEQLAEFCRSPLADLAEMLAQVRQPPGVAAGMRQRLDEAKLACRDGDYEAGLAQAIRLARDIGRLEARTLARVE